MDKKNKTPGKSKNQKNKSSTHNYTVDSEARGRTTKSTGRDSQ